MASDDTIRADLRDSATASARERGAAGDRRGDVTRDGADNASRGAQAASPGRIGRYHVLERLGAGGMGVVFAAYDPELDRRVAVKLLHPDSDSGDSQVRLLREAQALARLSHPNVVQIHDAGAFGERVFIAMEFIRGLDLRDWLVAEPRDDATIVRVFLAAGRGLAAAHAQGLVHRDFKPENVLVGADDRVCVADFGLARAELEAGASSLASARGGALDVMLTVTGAVLGTPAYMSPEQHLGQPADARSDQFSFCVALWEALYGKRPFAGDSVLATAAAVIAGQIEAPPAARRLPRQLVDALRRGLDSRPERRFPDLNALLVTLARDPARTRRRWLIGAVVSALSLGAVYSLAEHRAAEAGACTGGASALAGVWDASQRGAVTAALRGGVDPEVPARVLAGLDARASAWVVAHRDACLEHRRGARSTAMFDAQVRCLERRKQALGRAVELLTTPGAAPDPVQLVARVPSVADCRDPEIAGDEAAWPDDPIITRRVRELEGLLVTTRAQHHAGDEVAAQASAAAATEAARQLELRPLLAEALLLQGQILTAVGDASRAREVLGEAAVHALATRRDALAAEALAVQLYLDGQLGERAQALAVAPLARAVAERLPAPAAALARLDNNLGTLALGGGELELAQAHFERATAELEGLSGADPLELANYWTNLALHARAPEIARTGFARATALLTGELGEDHLLTLALRLKHGMHEPELEAGAEILAAACPRIEALHPTSMSSCASCYQRLGLAHASLDHKDEALEAFVRVPACLRNAGGDPMQAEHFAVLRGRAAAAAALLEGRPAEALVHADEVLVRAEPHQSMWWVAREVAEIQLARGRALIALDRKPEGLQALERAIALLTELSREHNDALLPRWLAAARALHDGSS